MRGIAYAVAAIAAVGIMISIASLPSGQSPVLSETSPASSAGTLTLSVPEMHCEFSCFPRVKETLEGSGGVKEVALAPQKEEGTLDNRQVIVSYEPGFDLGMALKTLSKEGFTDSAIVH